MGESIKKENQERLKKWLEYTCPCNGCKRKEQCGELSTKISNKAIELFPIKIECWWREIDYSELLNPQILEMGNNIFDILTNNEYQ